MLNKIYFASLIITLLVMSFLTYFSYSQLQSIGFPPPQIIQNFDYFDGLHKTILWISALLLLILAYVIMFTNRQAWALWTTFVYFSVFILINLWWLKGELNNYIQLNNNGTGGFQTGAIFGAFFVIVVGIGTIFNQLLGFKILKRISANPKENLDEIAAPNNPEEIIEETNN